MGALWAVTPGAISAVWLNGWTSPGGEQWIALLYLSVVNSVLAYLLWNFALVRLPAAMVGTSLYIQPILGATLSWLFLSERLPATFIPGAALVMTAVWIAGRPATRRAEHPLRAPARSSPGGGRRRRAASHRVTA